MSFLGMDTDLADDVAGQLEARAGSLDQLAGSIDRLVQRAGGVWHGADADAFTHWWSERERARMLATVAQVEVLAAELRRHVAEQERASGETSAAPTGPSGSVLEWFLGVLDAVGDYVLPVIEALLAATLVSHLGRFAPRLVGRFVSPRSLSWWARYLQSGDLRGFVPRAGLVSEFRRLESTIRGVGRAARVLDVGFAAYDGYQQYQQDARNPALSEAARTGRAIAAAGVPLAASAVGGVIGGVIGSVIPGPGTLVGAAVGGMIGNYVGERLRPHTLDAAGRVAEGIAETTEDVAEELSAAVGTRSDAVADAVGWWDATPATGGAR